MQRSLTCVLYHHIGEETDFECGLSISTTLMAFEQQISRLNLDYEIINLKTVIENNIPKRALLITFDDYYRSVVDVAESILYPKKLPSVFFINSNILGQDSVSLDCILSWCVQNVGMKRVCSEMAVEEQKNLGALISQVVSSYTLIQRDEVRRRLLETFGPIDLSTRSPILEPHDLARLPALGIEIGNHTATHVHCGMLSSDEHYDELVASKHRLETLSGATVRSFSVPYGHERDLTPDVLTALRKSGHEAIFLVHARSNRLRPANDIWYRVSLHNEKPRELSHKLKILPLMRSFKNIILG